MADQWWAPYAGFAVVAATFLTMPEWMPAVRFLSVNDGVVVALYTMLTLGMVLVLGYCGQLMLATNAFYGMGSYGLAILAVHQGLSPWIGLVASVVLVGIGALLIGLLVFRLKGHLLGLVTLVIGYISYVVFDTSSLTGGAAGMSAGPGLSIGSISFLGGTTAFFYLCAAASLVSLVLIRNLVVSRTGRALRAVEASEPAASSAGVNATRYKVIAFVVGAMVASVAGSLYAGYVGVVGAGSFNILLVVEILLMAVVGGLRSVWAAPFGVLAIVSLDAALQTYGSSLLHVNPAYITTVGYGVVLILVLLFLPGGLSSAGHRIEQLVESRRTSFRGNLDNGPAAHATAGSEGAERADAAPAGADAASPIAGGGTVPCLLEAVGITCHFDGLIALDGVSLQLQSGQVIGLIGPNGAGKTTFFNCLSGHVQPTSGVVRVDGQDVTGLAPYRIARHGLGRTFQNVELFPDMTVRENVMVGAHLCGDAGAVSAMLRLPRHWRDERGLADRANRALERVGMADHAAVLAGALAYGQQRRIEIARALAGEPHVLLLDEPASGLTAEEAEELVELIRALARESLGVVLVEHNMRALMNAADLVTVLASGRQLLTGLPDEVRQDPVVISSYLGTTHVDPPDRLPVGPAGVATSPAGDVRT